MDTQEPEKVEIIDVTPQPTRPSTPHRPRSIVGPVILILLGASFLLNNFGIVDFNIWDVVWRLWPVWLIAVGLDIMIGRRTAWGTWIVLGVVAALVGGSVWFASAVDPGGTGEPVTVNRALENAKRADVEILAGVSRMRVGDSAGSSLISGLIEPLSREHIRQDYSLAGDTARYTVKTEGRSGWFPFWGGSGDHEGNWDLNLNTQVPMTLRIDTGVGRSDINLAKVLVTDLRLDTGVGETTLTLPQKGQVHAKVDSGVGSLNIYIPKGVAARIRVDNGIGQVSVDGSYQHRDKEYISAGYDTAENRIDLDINGGVGAIHVEETAQ